MGIDPTKLALLGLGVSEIGTGGGLRGKISSVSLNNELQNQDYLLNSPANRLLGERITNNQQFRDAKTLHSGGCFENFFAGAEGISDYKQVKDKDIKENKKITENLGSERETSLGCSIQQITYRNHLTKVIRRPRQKEWRVLPKQMVYKSEIALKNDNFGIALWTLWTGDLMIIAGSEKFSRLEDNLDHRLFLLQKEGEKWEVKGKYHIPMGSIMKMDNRTLNSKKLP